MPIPAKSFILEDVTIRSDVYVCRRCRQICLANVGGPIDESGMGKLLKGCDESVVEGVMDS